MLFHKRILIFYLLLIIQWVICVKETRKSEQISASVVQCPEDNDEDNPTLLANPNDCSSFYKCSYGVPHLIPCPYNLEFNPKANRCDYPDKNICNIGSHSEKSVEGCPYYDDENNPTLLPDESDCNRYYKCHNGYRRSFSCGSYLEFNTKISKCDYPRNSNCSINVSPPSDHPNGCPIYNDEHNPTLLPHKTDCRLFYKCHNGHPEVFVCPYDHHWNIEKNYCDYPETANCVRPLNP